MTIPIRGTAALVVAAVIVAATAIWLPAYRWFLLISIAGRRTSGRWGWGRKQGAGAK